MLDLVSARTRQEDRCGVRVDPAHGRAAMRARILQEGEHGALRHLVHRARRHSSHPSLPR